MGKNEQDKFFKLLNENMYQYRKRIQNLSGEEIYNKYNEIKIYETLYKFVVNEYEAFNVDYLIRDDILDYMYEEYKKTLYGLDESDLHDFWGDILAKAQKEVEPDIKYLIRGKLYNPIRFGKEIDDWGGREKGATCGDCGCKSGEQHLSGCDIERCPCCGLQMLSCDCGVIYIVKPEDMDNLPELIKEQEEANKKEDEEYKKFLEEYDKENLSLKGQMAKYSQPDPLEDYDEQEALKKEKKKSDQEM